MRRWQERQPGGGLTSYLLPDVSCVALFSLLSFAATIMPGGNRGAIFLKPSSAAVRHATGMQIAVALCHLLERIVRNIVTPHCCNATRWHG